jgi:hypothetical protein
MDQTLESLARRVAELEARLAVVEEKTPKKDWRSVIGLFKDDREGILEIIEEGRRIREADREAARNGQFE